MAEKCIRHWITTMFGGAGYFAVHVGMFKDDEIGEYQDVIQTGIGRYKTSERAIEEAKEWAKAENLPLE